MEQELRTEKLHVEKADEGLTCVLKRSCTSLGVLQSVVVRCT